MQKSPVLDVVNLILVDRIKIVTKLLSEMAEANNGQEPKVGKSNRLHAPVNGYLWGDDIYSKGQFLNEEANPKAAGKNKAKIVVTVPLGTALKKLLKSDVSFGSSWIEDNKTVSYAYISGLTLGEVKKFDQFKKNKQKIVMLETEAKAKDLAYGKPYKFSLKGASYAFNFGSECEYLYYLSENGLTDKISYNHLTKKLESPLQGNMVVNAYFNTNLYHDIGSDSANTIKESFVENNNTNTAEEMRFSELSKAITEAPAKEMLDLVVELRKHIDAYPEAFKSAKQKGLIS